MDMNNEIDLTSASNEIKQRRQQRWQLIYYLSVRDAESQELIGHVVDISTDGIMLISEKCIAPDCEYHFSTQTIRAS